MNTGKLVKMQIPIQVALKCSVAHKLQQGAETVGPGAVPIARAAGDPKTEK